MFCFLPAALILLEPFAFRFETSAGFIIHSVLRFFAPSQHTSKSTHKDRSVALLIQKSLVKMCLVGWEGFPPPQNPQ